MFPLILAPLSPLGAQIGKRIMLLDFLAAGDVSLGVDLAGIADAMAVRGRAASGTWFQIDSCEVKNGRIAFHGWLPSLSKSGKSMVCVVDGVVDVRGLTWYSISNRVASSCLVLVRSCLPAGSAVWYGCGRRKGVSSRGMADCLGCLRATRAQRFFSNSRFVGQEQSM